MGCLLGVTGLFGQLAVALPTQHGSHLQVASSGPGGQTSLAIEVPAFHGLEPNLQLGYDPSAGNGWLGVGWSLSGLSDIERTARGRGAPAYDGQDLYYLDGVEVMPCRRLPESVHSADSPSCRHPAQGSLQAYFTKTERFKRVAFESSPMGGNWYVWDKDGTKQTYRPFLTGSFPPSHVAGWHLASVEDTLGNKVNYNYSQNTDAEGVGQEYLKTISYDGAAITFYSELRPDPIDAADGKALVVDRYRLKTIDVAVGGERVRAYSLRYERRLWSTARSVLYEVRQYGRDATLSASGTVTGGTAMPAVTFKEQPGGGVGSWKPGGDPHPNPEPGPAWNGEEPSSVFNGQTYSRTFQQRRQDPSDTPYTTGDVNGDGQTDWVKVNPNDDNGPPRIELSVGLTDRMAAPSVVSKILPWPDPDGWGGWGDRGLQVWAADINGDGKDDLLMTTGHRQGRPEVTGVAYPQAVFIFAALSKGDGTFNLVQTPTETAWIDNPDSNHDMKCQPGDPNGDGRYDLMCVYSVAFTDPGSPDLVFIGTAFSKGNGTFNLISTPAPNLDPYNYPPDLAVGDTEGDGNADAMLAYGTRWVTGRSRGDGTYDFTEHPANFHGSWGKLRAGDINGDGRADFIRVVELFNDPLGKGLVQTLISQPDGTLTPHQEQIPDRLLKPFPNLMAHVTAGDADGDGASDLLFAMPVDPHPATACSGAFTQPHTSFTRVLGNRDGTFRWPATWTDCGIATEKGSPFEDLLAWTGLQAPDVNGDGIADLFGIYTGAWFVNILIVVDVVSPDTGADSSHTFTGDVNGDGRQDEIHIHTSNTSNTIYTLLRKADGQYLQKTQPVMQGDHQVIRNFKTADVNGDGRTDLIYMKNDRGDIWVDTLLSKGDGTWDEDYRLAWHGYDAANHGETGADTPNWRAMDVDGDGRTDLVHLYPAGQNLRISTLLSNGDGNWSPLEPSQVPGVPTMMEPTTVGTLSWQQADVNGDGRMDLVRLMPLGKAGALVLSLLSGGDGITWRRERQPISGSFLATDLRRWLPADANGDGKTDLVRVDQTATELDVHSLLSMGNGSWTAKKQPDVLPAEPLSTSSSFADTARWRAEDVNGDGRTDLVHLLPLQGPAQTPGAPPQPGLRVDTLMSIGGGYWAAVLPKPDALPGYSKAGALQWHATDANGDGEADLVRVDRHPRSGALQVTTLESSAARDLVTGMDNGLGNQTEITYKPSSEVGSRTRPAPGVSGCHLPSGLVVQLPAVTVQQTQGTQADRQTISYACARWSYTERRLLGWAQTTTVHAATFNRPAQITVERNQLDDTCLARPAETLLKDSAGNVLTRSITSYVPTGVSPPAICLPSRLSVWQYNGGSVGQETQTVFHYDAFGNLERTDELGNPAKPADDRIIRRVFKPQVGPWIVNLPASEEVLDGTTATARRYRVTVWCYDGANGTPGGDCPGVPVKGLGLLTAAKRLNDRGRYHTTSFGYDSYGNRASVTDPRGNTTTTTYDPVRHILPEQVCNARNQCTVTEWDRNQEQVRTVTDPNHARTEFTSNIFGGPKTALQPGHGLVSYSYLDWDDPSRRRIRETIDDGTPDGLWSETWLDGLDRTYMRVKEGDQPGRTFVQHTFYTDASSRPGATTNWTTLPAGDPPVLEHYTYDAAGRLTAQTHPDGTARHWDYGNEATRTWVRQTDERDNTKTLFSDAHGRLTTVEEPDGSQVSRLTYGYDAAYQVRTITDNLGNVTTHTYDLLGNLTRTDDPDLGLWQWTWDQAGNLHTQTDARGRQLTYTYDQLNRQTTKTYKNGTKVVWHYDEPGHGASIGRLTSVADPTGQACPGNRSQALTYDAAGQITTDTRCIDADSQTMRFAFDQLGRQKAIIYPDQERQTYGYDSAGRLRDMPGLIGEFNYDADGHMTKAERADSTITTWTWDPKRRWLNEIDTASPVTGPLLKLGYTHEPNGLIKTSTTSPGGPNLSYTYDSLGRLTDVSGDLTQHFTWNTIGNLQTNSTVGTYTYPTPGAAGCTQNGTPEPCKHPHAPNQASDETYDYDANGNTTAIDTISHPATSPATLKQYVVKAKQPGRRSDTLWAIAADHLGNPRRWLEIFTLNKGRPYPKPPGDGFNDPSLIYPGQRLIMPANATGLARVSVPAASAAATAVTRHLGWNDDNRLAMSQDPSGQWTRMLYDAAGDRVEKWKGDAVTHYFDRWLEDASPGPGTIKYYWAGPTLIARRDSRGQHFYHQDHLGSTRMLTTGTGKVSARYTYQPFGAPLQNTGNTTTDLQFTGQRHDDGSGRILMGARYYNPARAAFISPDTIIPDPTTTQAANRYAYAYGSPLAYIDPSGNAAMITYYHPPPREIVEVQHAILTLIFPPMLGIDAALKEAIAQGYVTPSGLRKFQAQMDAANLMLSVTTPLAAVVEVEVAAAAEVGSVTVLEQALADTAAKSTQSEGTAALDQSLADTAAKSTQSEETAALDQALKDTAAQAANLQRLQTRNAEVHSILDPIAQEMRTTAVIQARTPSGELVDVVSGGAQRDLSPAQRAALKPGEVAAKLPGADAEMTGLHHITGEGWEPVAGDLSRDACPICRYWIEESGGIFINDRQFVFPENPPPPLSSPVKPSFPSPASGVTPSGE
jgi:RHS repeat-associated protein